MADQAPTSALRYGITHARPKPTPSRSRRQQKTRRPAANTDNTTLDFHRSINTKTTSMISPPPIAAITPRAVQPIVCPP